MKKTRRRDPLARAICLKTARLTGFTPRYVKMVMDGEAENEEIFRVVMLVIEGEKALLREIKKLAPTFECLKDLRLEYVELEE